MYVCGCACMHVWVGGCGACMWVCVEGARMCPLAVCVYINVTVRPSKFVCMSICTII